MSGMEQNVYDVLQVGYGPVSQSLAMMLGRQGRSICVVERWEQRYSLPRAAAIDHEINRVLCANGLNQVMPSISHPMHTYRWHNAEWKELLSLDLKADDVSGGNTIMSHHQPTLEAAMDEQVGKFERVDVLLGWEVLRIEQQSDYALVHLRQVASGEERSLRARYVVGCDGANSRVREEMEVECLDRGFDARWLVVDVFLRNGKTAMELGIPEGAQWCNPARPTTVVPSGIRNGEYFRRWEFFCFPHETDEEMENEARIWELLADWGGPEQFEIIRHKVYRFRSLTAEVWRKGRMFLAGDAAHLMPPFLAQGLVSGVRDTWNLAWKIGLVLDGKAEERLLDLYEIERKPHVQQIIDRSVYLGQLVCIADPNLAAERDAGFFTGKAPPPPAFPHLTSGLIRRGEDGIPRPGSGLLAPAGRTFEGSLDELIGLGWVIFRLPSAAKVNDARSEHLIARLGMIDFEVPQNTAKLVYAKIRDFMESQNWHAMVVRPDFYVYGGASAEENLALLINDLERDLVDSGFIL